MAINFYGGLRSGSSDSTQPAGWTSAYGGIPNLPKYVTDTQTMLGTDKQAQMLANLPGYQAMLGADVGNIQANLAGRVAPDVLSLLQQQAAERGIGTGVGGAPNTDAAYLRALGLTSLQLQQLGHTQLTEAMARTPMQESQTTTTKRDTALERAIYAAAPDPRAAAMEAQRLAREAALFTYGLSNKAEQRKGPSYSQFVGLRPATSAELAEFGRT